MAPLAASADPPGRVGSLSFVQGEVSVFTDPEQGWVAARVNDPLTSENSVWTEPGARAEVRFGSTAVRLADATQLDIVRLDDEVFHGHVARGSASLGVRYFDKGETYWLTSPGARFQVRTNGRYRLDVDPDRGESLLTVFSGNARLEAAGGYINVDTGRAVRVTGGDRPRYEFEAARSTAIDEWALARDQRYEEREAARYVPPQMTGWEDLDDYGVWRNEPDYGPVWFPTRVDSGWAPYRYGRWTWARPWGWTWVDDAPWGYAPFHYGRWVYVGNRWGWYPGQYDARPVWAPALVGWIGGSGWSVSISTGPADVLGWYPLSPFDDYRPWYSANAVYVTNINRVVIPPRHDRDRRDGWRDGRRDDRRDDPRDWRRDNRDHGATVVPREHFGGHRPVQNVMAPVGREVIAAQPFVSGAPVLPTRNEWRGRNKPLEVAPSAPQRAPVGGQPVGPRPATPVAPSAGAPVTRPMPAAPAPAQPSAPQRYNRPTPTGQTLRTKPAEPAVAPRPAQPAVAPRAVERPAAPPVPAERVRPPEARGSQPGAARPVERVAPAPVPQAAPRPAPAPQPSARPAPVPQPSARPAPAQEHPAARGSEKPRASPERPARGVEKPAARPDQSGGGG